MKILKTIASTKFLRSKNDSEFYANSYSVVGNAPVLLEKEHGERIDSSKKIVRFNNAQTKKYEIYTGNKTDYRILNCHYILNIHDDAYFQNQKNRYPNMKKYALYEFENENLIFKTDPSWQLWQMKKVLEPAQEKNNVFFIHEDFYNLGKKITLDKEPSNGFYGLLMSLKFTNNINCFGFNFYKDDSNIHYFDKTNKTNQQKNHDFSTEEKYFKLFQKAGIINTW